MAAVGIVTSAQPPTSVVNIQGGMAVQPVVLVDQNGNYVTPGGSQTTAGSLATTTVPVNVAAATAPTSGQVLTATSGTTATWQPVSAELPITTLGDTMYENATPAPARLAGNITATKNFLTQTGTGAVSAAPAWGTIAAGDLPAGTTSTQGALQLDGTASDIQPTGTRAAGAIGKAADAGHVHFSSGMYLCTPQSYAPSAQQVLTTTSATLAVVTGGASTVAAGSNGGEISQVASWSSPSAGVLAVANGTLFNALGGTFTVATSSTTATCTYTGVSGNTLTGVAYVSGSATGTVSTGGAVTMTSAAVNTGSFTAPPSGSVVVTVNYAVKISASALFAFCLSTTHGGVTPACNSVVYADNAASETRLYTPVFLVAGLNGTNNLDLLFAVAGGNTLSVMAYGTNSATPTGTIGAPVTMTVQAV